MSGPMQIDQPAEWLDDVSTDEVRRIVDALYRVHHLNAVITDMGTVLRRIMEESRQLAAAEACSLLLFDDTTRELYFFEAFGDRGDQEALKRRVRLKLGEGIAGAAAESRTSIIVNDAGNDPRVFREADAVTNLRTRTLLAVPMVRKGELVGVIEVVNKVDGAFNDADQHILELFASMAAGVLLNARLIEENLRSERLAAVGQTVAGLSHHTRNILAGLQGSVELIDEGLGHDDMPVVRKGWNVLKRSAERLSMVVSDMLAYAKDREAVKSPCDLRPVIDEVVESFRLLFARKDATFKVDAQGLPQTVLADAEALHRAVLNLISNAGDAIPEKNGELLLRAGVEDSELRIELHDNGSGVEPQGLGRIFDPFYSTKGSGGTGIGLAVTAKIVKEHGGTIEVERSPLGGALFRIRIPQEGTHG